MSNVKIVYLIFRTITFCGNIHLLSKEEKNKSMWEKKKLRENVFIQKLNGIVLLTTFKISFKCTMRKYKMYLYIYEMYKV